MNKHRRFVTAIPATKSSGRIKSGALKLFKGIRWLGGQGAKTPGRFAAVGRDIADAWRESAQC